MGLWRLTAGGSAACGAGGFAAFLGFRSVAEVRCPYESVPVREWLLSYGALAGALLGALLFVAAWVAAVRAGVVVGDELLWGIALLACAAAVLVVPFDLMLIKDLHDDHSVGMISECFGKA